MTELTTLPIPVDERTRATYLIHCCLQIDKSYSKKEALKAAVQYMSNKGYPTSAKSIERAYYKWRELAATKGKTAADKSLLDGRKASMRPSRSRVHQARFLTYWRHLAATYQRSSNAAVKELYRRWHAGDAIPGYETCHDRRALPTGWSDANLRKLLPSKKELVIYRQGYIAAKSELAQTFTTRAGSYPCEFVMFDDVWIDRLSYFGTEINRSFQLGTLDFYTGKRLVSGTKFRHRRKDGTHVYLNGDEMLLVVCDLLANVGYNAKKGTTLVVENGTAAISKALEEQLYVLTGGMVKIDRSGLIGAKQLLKGYGGRVKGNPNHKAHIESWHNLFHNCLCYGNGTVGKDRRPPETLHGIVKAEKQLLKHASDLPIERAALLDHHLPSFLELYHEASRVTAEINARTDHELEGWLQCGWVIPEFCLDPNSGMWGDMRTLAPAAMALVQSQPKNYRRMRKMSPDEAWDDALADPENTLTKLSPLSVAQLLASAPRLRRKLVREGARFVLRDKTNDFMGQDLWFETRVVDTDGNEREVNQSAKGLTGIVNPFDLTTLYVFNDAGCLLGKAQQINAVKRSDQHGMREAWGRSKKRQKEQMLPMQQDLAQEEELTSTKLEYNERVVNNLPATPRELANAEAEDLMEESFAKLSRSTTTTTTTETHRLKAVKVNYDPAPFID